jgi:hypothetical protein
MLCGPKGSTALTIPQCAVCGRQTDLCELPGRNETYCLQCSADVAASILLTTEIDAATTTGEETAGLVSEFMQVSRRILARSQWV